MVQRIEKTLVQLAVADVILRVGAVESRTRELVLALPGVAEKHLSFVGPVEIDAPCQSVEVPRNTAAGIEWRMEVDGIEDGLSGGNVRDPVDRTDRHPHRRQLPRSGNLTGSGIRTGTVGPEVGLGVGRQHGYKRRVEYLLGFGGRTPHPRPLGGLINEQFVFDNWASNIKAKLISGVCSLGSHDHTSSVVGCVVCVGIGGVGREAVELPAGTVPIVGTRLRG